MNTWKTPDNYITGIDTCDYDIRQKIGCTKLFHKLGFFKNGRWDEYGRYQALCKKCDYFIPEVGIYFGNGNYSDNIQEKETVFCFKISTQKNFCRFYPQYPNRRKCLCSAISVLTILPL